MTLTPDQVTQIKKQLKEQVKQQNFPEEEKEKAYHQIDGMSNEALEILVRKQAANQKSVFRSIIEGEIPAKKIAENIDAIAVLEIKPISKGHTIIIQKVPAMLAKSLTTKSFELAKEVSDKIQSSLNAQSTEIQTQFSFGEIIINIIPVYDKSLSINSPRYDATESELNEVYHKLKLSFKQEKVVLNNNQNNHSAEKEVFKLKRKVP